MKRRFPTRLVAPTLKIACAAVVAALLFMLITNAIKNPIASTTSDYRAEFSDVSGLRPNADVRIRGVRVGKVTSIAYQQNGTRASAVVEFTVERSRTLTDQTRLAIKYANLSGIRYLDVTGVGADGPGRESFGLENTTPSFDITELFNGLQPTLQALTPSEINAFTSNALALVQGDGGGLEPMLKSIDTLGRYTTDREKVISVLVANLSRISATLGGRSPQIIEILHLLEAPINKAMSVLDEFGKGARFGPPLMGTLDQILAGLGIDETADSDVERLFSQAFPTLGDLGSALSLIPTIAKGVAGMTAADGPTSNPQCSRGVVPLPATVQVLLGGNAVVVCKG